jgi:hypothetical protein
VEEGVLLETTKKPTMKVVEATVMKTHGKKEILQEKEGIF